MTRLLAFSFLLCSGCLGPKLDTCIILHSHDLHCYPGDSAKPEYTVKIDDAAGYTAISSTDYAILLHWINDHK